MKNTNELRISTGITRLWLNEDEEGAAEINAAIDMKEDMWSGRTLTFYEKGLRFEEE